MRKHVGVALGVLSVLALAVNAHAQMMFKKVEARTAYASVPQGATGQLVVSGDRTRFVNSKSSFEIPNDAIRDLFYSRVSGRRIKTAVATAIFTMGAGALLALSKGRKHYVTLTFDDGGEIVGAVEFKLHKSNYRGCLRALEQVTGVTMLYDQEGIKDKEQKPAERSGSP